METRIFNNKNSLIEGWYWLCRSDQLKNKKALAVKLFNRELVVYRGESGKAYTLDAYCPHMGAHLSQGDVIGEDLRCFFHHWKFDCSGACVQIPAQNEGLSTAFVPKVAPWPTTERYGLIWVWTGTTAKSDLPIPLELVNEETDALLGNCFTKNCHPNVVMINAIDAQHFNSVHPMVKKLAGNLYLEPTAISENTIEFKNKTHVPQVSLLGRLLSRFYSGAMTYWMSYWFASTGTVTVGPDFLHFHIIFALRPTPEGTTEGQTILVTKKRKGFFGKICSAVILRVSQIVGNYFAKGDTLIFSLIKFDMKAPIKADHAIIRFIQHAEGQTISTWSQS